MPNQYGNPDQCPKRRNYIPLCILRLWQPQKDSGLRRVQKQHAVYFLALILALVLADMQLSFFLSEQRLGTLDSASLMNLSYSLAAGVILFLRLKDIRRYSRISAVMALAGYFSWLVMPTAQLKLISLMICWAGLGGCAAGAVYAYAFVLVNAERLMTILLIIANSSLLLLLYEWKITLRWLGQPLSLVLILALAFCVFRFRKEDMQLVPAAVRPVSKSSFAILFCVVAFFTISFFGETMLRLGHYNRLLYAAGVYPAIVLAIVLQIVMKRNVWNLWNIFQVCSVTGILFMALSKSEAVFAAGTFIFGIAVGVGYIVVFYLAGGMIQRSGSFSFFKKALFAAVIISLLPSLASSLLARYHPQVMPLVTLTLSVLSLLLFTLYSPALYRYILRSEWLDDCDPAKETERKQSLDGLGLTPREKDVCALLLEGCTLRQISGTLKISYSTVNTYCTSLYRKLAINSRTELFVYYGASVRNGAAPDLIRRERYAAAPSMPGRKKSVSGQWSGPGDEEQSH